MNIDLMPLWMVGAGLVALVIVMIVWRKVAAMHEDDTLHVLEGGAVVQNQEALARRLAVIDKWGKLLTALTLLYLAGVAALYFYQLWVKSGSTIKM